jgi:hypothetical protein
MPSRNAPIFSKHKAPNGNMGDDHVHAYERSRIVINPEKVRDKKEIRQGAAVMAGRSSFADYSKMR